jgi:hypothetical protein
MTMPQVLFDILLMRILLKNEHAKSRQAFSVYCHETLIGWLSP